MHKIIYELSKIDHLAIDIPSPSLIFLYGDLGAGKTTLSATLISQLTGISKEEITSPTYVYYNNYKHIYHFDLYRLESYEEFINIGGEEILDNNTGIIFIEWPEKIEKCYTPDLVFRISTGKKSDGRILEIEKK